MNWGLCLAALVAPIGIGDALIRALWPAVAPRDGQRLVQAMLGVPLGYGVTSALFYVWLSALGPPGAGFAIAETAVVVLLAVRSRGAWRSVLRNDSARTRAQAIGFAHAAWCVAVALIFVRVLVRTPARPGLLFSEVLALVGALAIGVWARRALLPAAARAEDAWFHTGAQVTFGLTVASFGVHLWNEPHGSWDAWAIWNPRARFLFRSGGAWRSGFPTEISWSRPDHPLMLPGTIVNGWMALGRESLLVPAALAAVFAGAVVVLLYCALSMLRDRSQGAVAAFLLMGTGWFLLMSVSETADIPLSLFFLATVVLLTLEEASPSDGRFRLLAGLYCGLACWTKNDRTLFAIATAMGWTGALASEHGTRSSVRQMRTLAVGMLPGLVLVACFKWAHAPPNPDMQYVPGSLLDPSRYATVARGLLYRGFWFGGSAVPLSLVLIGYATVMGLDPDAAHRLAFRAGTTALALVMGMLCTIYLTTRYFPAQSWDRLMMQHWPWVLFLSCLVLRSPASEAGTSQPGSPP